MVILQMSSFHLQKFFSIIHEKISKKMQMKMLKVFFRQCSWILCHSDQRQCKITLILFLVNILIFQYFPICKFSDFTSKTYLPCPGKLQSPIVKIVYKPYLPSHLPSSLSLSKKYIWIMYLLYKEESIRSLIYLFSLTNCYFI